MTSSSDIEGSDFYESILVADTLRRWPYSVDRMSSATRDVVIYVGDTVRLLWQRDRAFLLLSGPGSGNRPVMSLARFQGYRVVQEMICHHCATGYYGFHQMTFPASFILGGYISCGI